MEGYINENRWIDLSGLPRNKNNKRINWQKSVGYDVKFKYEYVSGVIHIVGYPKCGYVNITIDKYVDEPFTTSTICLLYCLIERLVYNKIADMRPDLIEYFVNVSDAYHYSVYSKQSVMVKCPICGRVKQIICNNLCNYGLACDMCSDGISIPNKMMRFVLEQCGVDFISEVSHTKGFSWITNNYRYDFYFKDLYNRDILIEMDGGFHRYNNQQQIDAKKDILAKTNGYKLIRIDCNYPNTNHIDYIIHNIMNSELKDLLPLHTVNWEICNKTLKSKLILQACKLWEEEKCVPDIAKIIGVTTTTVKNYLQRGKTLGLCPSYSREVSIRRSKNINSNAIAYICHNEIKYVFANIFELINRSIECFGVQCNARGVYYVCSGKRKHHRGLQFKYITKEEYEQYKMINNEVVLQEAI